MCQFAADSYSLEPLERHKCAPDLIGVNWIEENASAMRMQD
jgi:hypothetical protein